MARAVAEGEASPDNFQQVLQQRLQMSALNREVTEQRAQEKGEMFLAEWGHLLDRLLDHMEAYEAGLQRQAEFFESGDPAALLEGNDMLAQAVDPLLETLQNYSQAYMAFGPSEYPLMNNVLNLLHGILHGTTNRQALEALVAHAVEYHEKAIEEIESGDTADSEGFEAKKKAFQDVIRALKELEPVNDVTAIDNMVRPLQLALEATTTADEKLFAEEVGMKPTNMPSANVLINTVKSCLSGMVGKEVVLEAMNWYRAFVEDLEEQFDLAVEGETNSLVILEELPKTREIIDLHDEIMERLEDAFEEMDPEVVEPLLEEMIDVVDRLEASSEVFLEAAQREGKLVCVKCGHANPPNNRSCESCHFKLPKLVDPAMFAQSTFELEERSGLEEETDDDYHMGINTYRLFEAAYNFYEGNIDDEAFQKAIDTSRQTLEQSEDGLAGLSKGGISQKHRDMMTPDQLATFEEGQEMYHETKELLQEGIDDWHDGLDYFEQFIETRHRPTLETGIQIIFEASIKIHKVHKLGEIAEKSLAEIQVDDEEPAPAEAAPAQPEEEPVVEQVIEETYDPGSGIG